MVVTTMTVNKGRFFYSSSENLDQQCWKRSPVIQHEKSSLQEVHCSWNFLAVLARNPPSPTFIYLKCWKKSSAFHCRCHYLKQWTDINDYCLKKSTVIYPYPHCWLKIHCVHQTTIHRTDWPLLQESTVVSTAGKNTGLYTVYQRCCKNVTVIHR